MSLLSKNEIYQATIGETLDQLEIGTGRIGMNTPDQSLAILAGMDDAYARIEAIDNEASRSILITQFESVLARLHKEAGQFLRDMGGVQALRRQREPLNPPREHAWWFLDAYLLEKRGRAARRLLIGVGVALVVLLALVGLYQTFLAPDPAVAARYAHQQTAQDLMMTNDLPGALGEVQQGLSYAPDDPVLLITQGVLQEQLDEPEAAETSFQLANSGLTDQSDFYLTRGQAYLLVNQPEKALVDGQEALRISPESAQAYLLIGQIYEVKGEPQQALDAYDEAFAAADKNKQYELAALARTRTAMLMQAMNSGMFSSETTAPTAVP